jgi:hypothetical protein
MRATKPPTLNPGTKSEASQKHKPLTTNEKAPKLKKLRGIDSVERTGLTDELTNPMERPAIKAAGNVAISTPGTTKSTTSRLSAVANKVNNVPIIIFSSILQTTRFYCASTILIFCNKSATSLSRKIDF